MQYLYAFSLLVIQPIRAIPDTDRSAAMIVLFRSVPQIHWMLRGQGLLLLFLLPPNLHPGLYGSTLVMHHTRKDSFTLMQPFHFYLRLPYSCGVTGAAVYESVLYGTH